MCRNSIHPFGNQAAAGDDPSALGFAPQPYDWFALFEDEEAAGLSSVQALPVGQARLNTIW